MGFLAVKNKKIYVFNNESEKNKLINKHFLEDLKLFKDNERENALKWAKINKVTGFLWTYEMENLEYIENLKKEEHTCVTISTKSDDNFLFLLNDVFYIWTLKYLRYDKDKDKLILEVYKDSDNHIEENFEESIERYAKDTNTFLEIACIKYFKEFKRQTKVYPWKKIEERKFKQDEDMICFYNACEEIISNKNIFFTKNIKKLEIKDSDIDNILVTTLPRTIKNETILKTIKNHIWL